MTCRMRSIRPAHRRVKGGQARIDLDRRRRRDSPYLGLSLPSSAPRSRSRPGVQPAGRRMDHSGTGMDHPLRWSSMSFVFPAPLRPSKATDLMLLNRHLRSKRRVGNRMKATDPLGSSRRHSSSPHRYRSVGPTGPARSPQAALPLATAFVQHHDLRSEREHGVHVVLDSAFWQPSAKAADETQVTSCRSLRARPARQLGADDGAEDYEADLPAPVRDDTSSRRGRFSNQSE